MEGEGGVKGGWEWREGAGGWGGSVEGDGGGAVASQTGTTEKGGRVVERDQGHSTAARIYLA